MRRERLVAIEAIAVYCLNSGGQNENPGFMENGGAKMRNIALLGLALFSGSIASAGLLTYTQTFDASGTLGGTGFTSQLVTLSETADSSNVTLFSAGTYENIGTVTVSIATIGTATFTDQMFAF